MVLRLYAAGTCSDGRMNRMIRRHLAGLGVILAALAIPLLAVFRPIGGHPVTAAPAVPPIVGSCLTATPTGPQQTACESDNFGIVIHSWTSTLVGPNISAARDQCEPWVQRYLDGNNVTPHPLGYVSASIAGPGHRWIQGWSWNACVFTPLVAG